MNTHKRHHGQTHISTTYPWGLNTRNGHRLLCSDGKIRAADLAPTADTFFSTPARIRISGKTVTGYMTVHDASRPPYAESRWAFVFRQHTGGPLPDWPKEDTPEYWDLHAAGETVSNIRREPTT